MRDEVLIEQGGHQVVASSDASGWYVFSALDEASLPLAIRLGHLQARIMQFGKSDRMPSDFRDLDAWDALGLGMPKHCQSRIKDLLEAQRF